MSQHESPRLQTARKIQDGVRQEGREANAGSGRKINFESWFQLKTHVDIFCPLLPLGEAGRQGTFQEGLSWR